MALDYKGLIAQKVAKPGLRHKIDAYCISCIYDEKGEGNWRQQVTACLVTDCPLFSVRPTSKGRKGD